MAQAAARSFANTKARPAETKLDFSLLDSLTAPGVFWRSPSELVPTLSLLAQTVARADAASYFAFRVHNIGISNVGESSENLRRREAYLRAALVEFVSMEYVIPQDMKTLGLTIAPPRICESPNPLVHAVAALRHMNVHLTSSTLSQAQRLAVWPVEPEPLEFTYEMWITQPLTRENLIRRKGPKYSISDVEHLHKWFVSAQSEWGVHHLVQHAIVEYGKFLMVSVEIAQSRDHAELSTPT